MWSNIFFLREEEHCSLFQNGNVLIFKLYYFEVYFKRLKLYP